jgi:tetratricopeptide (TPR) repeat protein
MQGSLEIIKDADAYFARAKYLEALDLYIYILRLFPTDFVVLQKKADSYYFLGHYELALLNYDRLVREAPNDSETLISALYARARLYHHLTRYKEEFSDHDRALGLMNEDHELVVDFLYARARLYHRLTRYKEEFADYDRALELMSADHELEADCLYGMARLYHRCNDYKNATESYQRVLELQPNKFSALYAMGRALIQGFQNYQNAAIYFKAAIKRNPSHASVNDAFYMLGSVYHWLGQYHKAIVAYKLAARTSAKRASSFLRLAVIFRELQRYQEAIDILDQAWRLRADDQRFVQESLRLRNQCCGLKKHKKTRSQQRNLSKTPWCLHVDDIKLMRNKQDRLIVLGSGSFAFVLLGALVKGGMLVAVKCSKSQTRALVDSSVHPSACFSKTGGRCSGMPVSRRSKKLSKIPTSIKEPSFGHRMHHPNVLHTYGSWQNCLVMPYIGGSLHDYLVGERLFWGQRWRLALSIVSGIAYQHNEQNLIHCDLKTDNILLDQHGEPKICDFGLMDHKKNIKPGVKGSWDYLAPELRDAKHCCTEATDMYSYGVILWKMVFGEARAFSSDHKTWIKLKLHREYRDLMVWCMKKPEARPTANEVICYIKKHGVFSHTGSNTTNKPHPSSKASLLASQESPPSLHQAKAY